MAIKKVIEIDVDQVQAMGGLEALQQSLVETETKSASLKAELRKLKEQLAQLPEGSEEYNKIAQRAGEVSDQIGDINTRIKALGSDTKNIDAVVQGAQALSGAFSIATSASALLGEENKDLQETMMKVESAIGLTVGIQSVANALQKETALSIGLSTVATKIQTGAQIVYATVVGTTTGALKALRVALLSTGVGALVVALGFLVAKMSESTEATEDQDKALADLTETQKRFNESLKAEIDGIQNSTQLRVLRAKIAGQSEKELREIEKQGEADRATAINNEIKRIDKELQNRKLSNKEFKLLQEERNKLSDESLKLAQDRDIKQLEFEVDIANKKRDAINKANDEAKAKADKLAEERKAKEQKELEEKRAFENAKGRSAEEAFDAILKREADAKEANRIAGLTELEQTQQKYDALIEQARLANVSTVELEIEKANAINEINLQIQAEEEKGRLAQKEADEKALADKKILKEQELALSAETFGKVAMLLGKNSKIGKAFAVGQALINTYQGITAELATKAVTPYEIGLKVANIAFVASTGFKAVKNILSTNPMSSGGGGASSGGSATGGGGSSAPQFNLVGQSSTNQLNATIAGQQNRPVQTFVVGSQVSTQQALDRNAVANSVFG
jgi:hypothetical protein